MISGSVWSTSQCHLLVVVGLRTCLQPLKEEFLSLQRKNIVFDELGAVVVVDGKTGQRRQRLILSVPFVAEWLSDQPDNRPEASLWIHNAQGCHEEGIVPLDYYAARKLLVRLQRKAGIQKHVNPHAFRHARATPRKFPD